MKALLGPDLALAGGLARKYVAYFLPEVGVGALLDLLAVYSALANIVVLNGYLAFILPALPLLSALIHGLNLGRSTWWWINEGYVLYLRSLPVRHTGFLLLYMAAQLLLGFLPLTILYYAAMLLLLMPLSRLLFVLFCSLGLFCLMFSAGCATAAIVKDWFKISAFSELAQWGLTALTPTLYDLRFLTHISRLLYSVVASNPITWLMQFAREASSAADLALAAPIALGSLAVTYFLCRLSTRRWTP
jgi:hypothetical protein